MVQLQVISSPTVMDSKGNRNFHNKILFLPSKKSYAIIREFYYLFKKVK